MKRSEAVKAKLSIAAANPEDDVELGLAMLNRCHQLLRDNGRLCIVLPETYFFSPSYRFVRDWCRGRFVPETVINVPMEAFQGFCRAKTNVYIFRKLPEFVAIKDESKRAAARKKGQEEAEAGKVVMLNPRTCGIYKSGAKRFKVTTDGKRTEEVDNQMLEHVLSWRSGKMPPGAVEVPMSMLLARDVVVPTYFDARYDQAFDAMKGKMGCREKTIGELMDEGLVFIRGGHGSPGNDLRVGSVPYVKVSDIRSLRVNVNPTNMIPRALAKTYWRGEGSGLTAWDVITPNRASSNIGEFALLLPGEEDIVLTKEMFVVRLTPKGAASLDGFYLLWALSLSAVRDQWKRVALMQTNREDVGARHREIRLPWPPEGVDAKAWTATKAKDFRTYFESMSKARVDFVGALRTGDAEFISSVFASAAPSDPKAAAEAEEAAAAEEVVIAAIAAAEQEVDVPALEEAPALRRRGRPPARRLA